MEKVLKIEKQPIIEEDLGLENTPIIQYRDEKEVWVTPIKMFKIVDNLQQLRAADFNKYSQGVVFGGVDGSVGNNTFYKWVGDSTEPENIPDVVTSALSQGGRWIKQDIGGKGALANFVTLDTEQTIEPLAIKTWNNFNKFYGHDTAGQIALIKDGVADNLMLTFCETDESNVLARIGYPERTSVNLEIFNTLGGDVAFNRDIVFSERNSADFNKVAFVGYTSNNLDNLIIRNEKSDSVYIANNIVGTDQNYLPKFSLANNADNLNITNLASGDIEFNTNLTFSGGRKLISFVETPVEIHQATPKDYVDDADENLQNQIDTNTQEIAATNTRIDAIDEKILQLSGSSVVIGQINKTKDDVEVDRETILDAFVQQVKSRVPKEGDSVYTTDNYAYYRLATAWSSPYTISINIANTTTAGLVKSVENIDTNRGKVKVDPVTGEMDIVKGDQLPYKDLANTFLEDQTFNKKARVKGTFYTEGLAFLNGENDLNSLSTGVRDPADQNPDPADKLLEVWNYNSAGVPSRRKGFGTYNKTVDINSVNQWEIVNMDAMQRYVATHGGSIPSNMVTTDTTQTITGQKTFNGRTYYTHTPTTNNELVNKKYVDDAVAAGGGGGGGDVYTTRDNTFERLNIFKCVDYTLPSRFNNSFWVYPDPSYALPEFAILQVGGKMVESLNASNGHFIILKAWNDDACPSFKWCDSTSVNSVDLYWDYWEARSRITLRNFTVVTRSFQSDPEWEQDYATANYVNQKLQALYDHIDGRLKTIEQALNIPTTLANESRAIKAMIDEIVVPKSKVTTLYEELNSLQGYEGLLDMSEPEERKQIFSTTDRAEQLRILDEIKLRKEEAERQQQEQNGV